MGSLNLNYQLATATPISLWDKTSFQICGYLHLVVSIGKQRTHDGLLKTNLANHLSSELT